MHIEFELRVPQQIINLQEHLITALVKELRLAAPDRAAELGNELLESLNPELEPAVLQLAERHLSALKVSGSVDH